MSGWVVNDYQTMIAGTRTLWHDLEVWLSARFVGNVGFPDLADWVEARAAAMPPTYIVRNAGYFRPLYIACPQVALVQDVFPPESPARNQLVEVCRQAAHTVFNTAYTRSQYPEIASLPHTIIPLSVDFDLFRPLDEVAALRRKWAIHDPAVCWIGAASAVKGYRALCQYVLDAPRQTHWALVYKHDVGPSTGRVRAFANLTHAELVEVINCCAVGLCTSLQETQHLAGIEMGACGLPVLAPDVGIYHGLDRSAAWTVAGGRPEAVLEHGLFESLPSRRAVRAFWMAQGVDRAACKAAWRKVVREVAGD